MLRKIAKRIKAIITPGDISPHRKVVSLSPQHAPRGHVLLAYIIDPFLLPADAAIPNSHTHYWESWQIAQTFLECGYAVDVISYHNKFFQPLQRYDYFISARTNLEQIAKRLNEDCVIVAHLDTAHWIYNNHAAYQRLMDLQRRRNITLSSIRTIEQNWAIENADLATVLGNEFTLNTYRYAGTPLYRIPISVPETYEWNKGKDHQRSRYNYLWFGSGGFVHKGLDLVLELFSRLPDFQLTVCGPLDKESRFVDAYKEELFNKPNIKTVGWVDVASPEFREIAENCVGSIYPSCSEGGGGCVITCMHAGLIPVVPHEASVDVNASYGILLDDCRIESLECAIRGLSEKSPDELRCLARTAWELARTQHTRERFASEFQQFVTEVLFKFKKT